jgi:3-oxoacyl-[acyl-carrier protein] reductase
MTINLQLKNKKTIITGANGGIGRALIEKFSEHGSDIIACVRKNNEDFNKKINEIKNKNKNNIIVYEFDLSNSDETEKVIEKIIKEQENIDVLINNAGMNQVSLFQMTTMKKFREIFEINYFSNIIITQKVLKTMMKKKKGSIINISSNAAFERDVGRSAYASSKLSLIALTQVLSKEFAKFNIRVNSISPGLTKTRMMDDVSDKVKEEVIKKIPLGRVADPKDIANAALFLASGESDYITGENLNITGGY